MIYPIDIHGDGLHYVMLDLSAIRMLEIIEYNVDKDVETFTVKILFHGLGSDLGYSFQTVNKSIVGALAEAYALHNSDDHDISDNDISDNDKAGDYND